LTQKSRNIEASGYSSSERMGRIFGWLIKANKKYGAEWWILVFGAVIILFISYTAIFPGTLAPYSPLDQNTGPQLMAPGPGHPFGTDNLSRDILSRMIYGSRTILGVAFTAAILSSIIGIPLGLISGFLGGIFDRIFSLIMDSVYSFPGLILAIAFAAMLGPGVVNITLAVSVVCRFRCVYTYLFQTRTGTDIDDQRRTVCGSCPCYRCQTFGYTGKIYLSQCHSNGCCNIFIFPEYSGCNYDRSRPVIYRAGTSRRHSGLGYGPCNG